MAQAVPSGPGTGPRAMTQPRSTAGEDCRTSAAIAVNLPGRVC
jgi:hypothetical protein